MITCWPEQRLKQKPQCVLGWTSNGSQSDSNDSNLNMAGCTCYKTQTIHSSYPAKYNMTKTYQKVQELFSPNICLQPFKCIQFFIMCDRKIGNTQEWVDMQSKCSQTLSWSCHAWWKVPTKFLKAQSSNSQTHSSQNEQAGLGGTSKLSSEEFQLSNIPQQKPSWKSSLLTEGPDYKELQHENIP